jgi:hypothetical protein
MRICFAFDCIGMKPPIRNMLQPFESALRGLDSFRGAPRLVNFDGTLQTLEWVPGAVDEMLEEFHAVPRHDGFLLYWTFSFFFAWYARTAPLFSTTARLPRICLKRLR